MELMGLSIESFHLFNSIHKMFNIIARNIDSIIETIEKSF